MLNAPNGHYGNGAGSADASLAGSQPRSLIDHLDRIERVVISLMSTHDNLNCGLDRLINPVPRTGSTAVNAPSAVNPTNNTVEGRLYCLLNNLEDACCRFNDASARLNSAV